MATKPAAKKSTSTAVARWDEELARQAAAAAATEESTATGEFFSFRGGRLSFNDTQMPGDKMAVIVLDGILENVKYMGDYDAENVQAPTCFAFARVEDDLKPHIKVVEAGKNLDEGAGACDGCPHNEWGSADKGRGKSCRNTRRLAMIPAGHFEGDKFIPFEDPEEYESSPIGYARLPVTSVTGYSGYVKQMAGALKRPPHAMFTKVSVVPDPKNQFKVVFEALAKVPDDIMEVIMRRHEEAKASIDFPYGISDEEEAPRTKGKPKASAKAAPPSRAAAKAAPKGRRY